MKKVLAILCMALVSLQAQIPDTKQLIVVTTKDWSAPSGTLQRYEKTDNTWHKVGDAIDIKLGRNGLGWGIGLHTIPKDAKIIKKEGDGKSPAGIFSLKQAFGYEPFVVEYPYEVYKATDHCVDDVHSKFYNKIVDSTKVDVDYNSKEHMKFPKNYYKYGVVVNHNHIDEAGAKKGAGSCIFLHIKSIPTAGCTVMSEAQMKALIQWLDVESDPLLVQGTEAWINQLIEEAKGKGSKKVEKLLSQARSKLGQSYQPGAVGPDHFDCSGFVYYLFREQQVAIPRTSIDQSRIGDKLSKEEIRRGDLLFFDTSEKGHVNHSGIYLGEGKFIHSSSGKAYGVTISDMNGWYKDKFQWGIRKIEE